MTNQNGSHFEPASLGPISGPLESMWQHFHSHHMAPGQSDESLAKAKYIYYSAAAQILSSIIESMKRDPSLTTTGMLCRAINQDLEASMSELFVASQSH